jgi:hypothetical protein
MKSFDAMRRNFLRTGSLGVAATAIPAERTKVWAIHPFPGMNRPDHFGSP